ncbi:MAG: cytochrome P460 family protein [Spirochaetota bacterium]
MKRLYILVIIFAVYLVGCRQEKPGYTFTLPENYRDWRKPVEEVLTYTVPAHGNGARIIYANDTAFDVSKKKMEDGRLRYDYPDTSMIIKEKYESEADIERADPVLTIMVKYREDPRAVNGWLYYMKNPGEKTVFVESKMCSGCHDAANEEHPYFDKNESENFRDYVFATF